MVFVSCLYTIHIVTRKITITINKVVNQYRGIGGCEEGVAVLAIEWVSVRVEKEGRGVSECSWVANF